MKWHLVSGGCGFVGRNIVKRLLAGNENIIIVEGENHLVPGDQVQVVYKWEEMGEKKFHKATGDKLPFSFKIHVAAERVDQIKMRFFTVSIL